MLQLLKVICKKIPLSIGNQRMHSAMTPTMPVVNAANYSGRGPGMSPAAAVGINPNIRYRTTQMPPYQQQYAKK